MAAEELKNYADDLEAWNDIVNEYQLGEAMIMSIQDLPPAIPLPPSASQSSSAGGQLFQPSSVETSQGHSAGICLGQPPQLDSASQPPPTGDQLIQSSSVGAAKQVRTAGHPYVAGSHGLTSLSRQATQGQGYINKPPPGLSAFEFQVLQVLVALPTGVALPTIQLVKATSCLRKSEINPQLYQMQRKRLIFKAKESPPSWVIAPEGQAKFLESLL